MMLKKGIVRSRAVQSAARSRAHRKANPRSGLGGGGSAILQHLTSTMERAEMRKSLLEWGDDDSILLKPYPIESLESGIMLSAAPGGVLDYSEQDEKKAV